MSNEPMFDYVLARSRTRETSILAVATIASSASLVLLGLFVQAQLTIVGTNGTNDDDLFHAYKQWIQVMGIAFAGLGIAYREATIVLIHKNDECWLKEYVQFWRELNRLYGETTSIGEMVIGRDCIKDPIPPHKYNGIREIVIRMLLAFPFLAWLFTIDPFLGTGVSGVTSILIVGFSLCHD